MANVCSSGFYWLRQLRRVRRSLDTDSMKTLDHAFVMSRVDYCNAILAGSPRYITDKLQRLLNAAAFLLNSEHGLWYDGSMRLIQKFRIGPKNRPVTFNRIESESSDSNRISKLRRSLLALLPTHADYVG